MQQDVPPANTGTGTVEPVALPIIDLPSASMSDSTRTHLCQQLVRSVLAAARALYAGQRSDRLAGLAQRLLSVPDSHFIQFLERKYEVLRVAMEVQPDASMAALADQLLVDLCSQ
jgi:hypothetical protein